MSISRWFLTSIFIFITACGGSGNGETIDTSTYTVAGNVSGLNGSLIIKNNKEESLDITSNSAFSFSTTYKSGDSYSVTIVTQPSNQTCVINNGSGSIDAASIVNIAIDCSNNPTYSVGGNLSGLIGQVVLQNNGSNNLTLTENASFVFTTALYDEATYSVTVLTQPTGETCSITNGSGTIAAANISDISVDCIDTGAPTVNSTTPTNNATDVTLNTTVTATFNEDMLNTSIKNSSFTLMGDSGVTGLVSFDSLSNIATFTPDSNLSMLTNYTATLTTDTTDLVGNPLASNYSWNFTTIDGTWGTPTTIQNASPPAVQQPQIAVDTNGNAITVWLQSDGTRFNIWANRFTASNSTWGTAQLIETNNDGHASDVQIAIDSNGNAIAVWSQNDGTRYNIYANRFTASSSSWSTAELIESDNTNSTSLPQVAIDSNGNAVAVWQQRDSTRENIWSNRYTASTTSWGTAELIETDNTGDAYTPQVAVDSNGNAISVWHQVSGSSYNIYANRYTASNSSWGTAELIETDNTTYHATNPQITIDSNNNAIVVWQQRESATIENIWANRFTASNSSWSSAAIIETNTGLDWKPQIDTDNNGNAIVVWYQLIGSSYNAYANRYTSSSNSWGNPELIVAALDSTPKIAFDSKGNAMAVWHQNDAGTINIKSIRYTAASDSWETINLVETADVIASNPQISFGATVNPFVIWQQNDPDTGIGTIHINRLE